MEVKACRECRRLFKYLAGDYICPECKEKLEEKFKEVKEYIADHTGAGMAQVARDCEVAIPQIKKWIREERLHLSDEREAFFSCEGCGKLIPTGKFCNLCKSQLLNEVGKAIKSDKIVKVKIAEKTKKDSPQMRFLSR